VLYAKDWHASAEAEAAGDAPLYLTPELFADDWLNRYFDSLSSDTVALASSVRDYRFVYLGPSGSHTPLHADVLRSYSWSANICGHKRWRLFPPDGGAFSDVLQGPGETLFVPSGWQHDVLNVGECAVLSVNHNWTCAAGVDAVWAFLQRELAAATAAIDDVRSLVSASEFDELVIRNVRANAGLDFAQFACLCWEGTKPHRAALRPGGAADDGAVALAALACRRAACILRELAAMARQRPSLLVEMMPAAAAADELDGLLVAHGFEASSTAHKR
jgi:hypothetical protein